MTKQRLQLFLGLLLTTWWMLPLGAAEKSLVVVMDDNYPPYVFRADDGTLRGYLPELWELWSQKTGTTVSLRATDWAEAQRLHASGKADVIDTIFRTPEREKYLEFSPPYADLPVSIYTAQNLGGITDIDSLRGFLVGVKEGDACVDRLIKGGVTNLKSYASYAQVIDAAKSQEIKIFCLDEPPANFLLYRAGADQAFHKAFTLFSGQFHRAVRLPNKALMQEVQRGFEAIKPEEMQRLHDKWLGSALNLLPWLRHLWIALAALALITSAVAIWVWQLRRAVRERTALLAQEQAQLRTLINTLPDLMWLKSVDGIYLACNPKFERFFGAREAQIVGKTDYDFVPKELADFFRAHDRKAMDAGGTSVNEEWVTFADDGHRELLETTKTPMLDGHGKVIGVLGISHDITERKRAENELEAHRNHLEALVKARTAELQSAKQAAETANVAKSAFLANISHEMRTPLHHVTSMAALIRREPLTDKQISLMDKLDMACHNLAGTMDTVLKLTRIESGKLDLAEEPFDPDQLVAETVALLQAQASAKHLCLRAETLTNQILVQGDKGYIKQALLNYLNNALRFTETGSIRVRVEVQANHGEQVLMRFEVIDTGIGITPEDQSRLFSLFEQIDNSAARKYGGLGAGLALTRKIAQLMGGDAGCNSNIGEGSTFWFSVMVKKA